MPDGPLIGSADRGDVAVVREASCVLCLACIAACPVGALSASGVLRVDAETCIGCGACLGACAPGALTLAARVASDGCDTIRKGITAR